MNKTRTACMIATVVAAALQFGCAGSHQARSVETTQASLINPDLLQKGTGDQALYRYVNPKADIRKYQKVLIEPVMVRKDGELDKEQLENFQKLANNAYVYLTRELEKDYQVVKTPGPDTMAIQMAIIDADSAKPVRNTLSTLMPIGIGLSLVKYSATGKQSGVGEISTEMKITDSGTGELLGAAMDRRVGGKEITELWSRWHNADDALQYWSKRMRFALCEARGDGNCVKP